MNISENEAHSAIYCSKNESFARRCRHYKAKVWIAEPLSIYFANHCRKVSGQHLDATEELDVLVVPLKQAVDMVMDNEICCNSSAHGILRVARLLGV